MTAKILDGIVLAQLEREAIKQSVQERTNKGLRAPGLAVLLVGDDAPSKLYVQKKRNACLEVGIYSQAFDYPNSLTEEALLAKIKELNQDDSIDGILVQLPLPAHISTEKVIDTIAPHKDVDGFHPFNLGKLAQHQLGLHPCTPSGVMTMLAHTGVSLQGKQACVVGASRIVGRPMALELLNQDATVSICHRYTQNLQQHVLSADILVVAVGKAKLIPGSWIKEGAIVIDVGINRLENGTLVGDVDFASAAPRSSYITPVPGGVGAMTVTALMLNTLKAAKGEIYPK